MEMNIQHAQKKKKLDGPVTTYRIIDVTPKVESATVDLVPKLEIGDDNSSVKHNSQVIHVPVDIPSNQKFRGFICFICNKSFKHGSHLKRHINTHTGDITYKCDLCEKTFLDSSTFNRHRKIHFGDKQASCNICGKSFGTLGSLRRHITVHNQDERPYQCETCLKRFPDISSYRKHVLIHVGIKPYTCDTCGKTFVHVGDLNGHCKIHVGVKPFVCERCGKDFAKNSNYNRHMRIHEGDREFLCNICGVSYNYQGSLTRHLVTHFGNSKKKLAKSTKTVNSESTLNEDNPDADIKDEGSTAEEDKSVSEACLNDVLEVNLKEIKDLSQLQEIKSEKQVTSEAFEEPDCDENDPTLLPPQDETISKQITTEDISSLLNVPDDFGSTKNISAPLLSCEVEAIATFPPDPLSCPYEEKYGQSSNEPRLIFDTPVESTNVLLDVESDPDETAEIIVPDPIS